jgi:hypothetical protein
MINKIYLKINSILEQGFIKFCRIQIDRTALSLLRRVYGFNCWHVAAPLSARPYRADISKLVNSLYPKYVVEVGCGLGITLSLINSPYRHGYDLDEGAIRAARFLRGNGIKFTTGDMTAVIEDYIDVLILVNWIHDYSPEQLASWLNPLKGRTRYLLLDAIDINNPLNYKYKHDFRFLYDNYYLISTSRSVNEGRHFCLFEVKN